MADLLANKTILVMDVANRRSIAWGCAQIMQEQGANLIYTYPNTSPTTLVAKSLIKKEQVPPTSLIVTASCSTVRCLEISKSLDDAIVICNITLK